MVTDVNYANYLKKDMPIIFNKGLYYLSSNFLNNNEIRKIDIN